MQNACLLMSCSRNACPPRARRFGFRPIGTFRHGFLRGCGEGRGELTSEGRPHHFLLYSLYRKRAREQRVDAQQVERRQQVWCDCNLTFARCFVWPGEASLSTVCGAFGCTCRRSVCIGIGKVEGLVKGFVREDNTVVCEMQRNIRLK